MKIKDLRRMSIGSTNGKEKYVKSFQNVGDITKQLKKAEKNSRRFAKKISPFFVNSNKIKTCRRVWAFLRIYIRYEAEPATRQTAKTIPRFFVDQIGDCKHYAVSCVGILQACGIPARFVVVNQGSDNRRWHVYAAAKVKGKEVIIDPCRKEFNSECRYTKRYKVKPLE